MKKINSKKKNYNHKCITIDYYKNPFNVSKNLVKLCEFNEVLFFLLRKKKFKI